MTIRPLFTILLLSTIVTIAFSQKTYFDKKVNIKVKSVKADLIRIKADTLTRYYDSLFDASASVPNETEIYRVTFSSFVPAITTIRYFRISDNNFVSFDIIRDEESTFTHRRIYDNGFTDKFRQLIDSTFWNYPTPTTELKQLTDDGGTTKIEGLKNKTLKVIERTNPAEYDTLFILPQRFFRRY